MLTPFKMGVGGKLGSGRQYMSWIAMEDEVRAIMHCLNTTSLSGPVNLVAPNPVTNAQFTKALAAWLHRPSFLPAPAFALKLAMGQMANELLLSSTRVRPRKLIQSGFSFEYPELSAALKAALTS
jgi:hypothetical protein